MPPPPPAPTHIIRSHGQQVNVLAFSNDNERMYSGDASGIVSITSTRTLRSLIVWPAHTDGLLGVEEWGYTQYGTMISIITHGRDNKMHVWKYGSESSAAQTIGGSATMPERDSAYPTLVFSLDVNALNYCRFSLLRLESLPERLEALVAVPNLVDSSFADVWTLPTLGRLHAAIGKSDGSDASIFSPGSDGRNADKTGIIMALHLFKTQHPSNSNRAQLRLLVAYENGGVTLFAFTRAGMDTSVEGVGWDRVWTTKLHVETVMGMAVSCDNALALTVSADNLVGRYDLSAAEGSEDLAACFTTHRTKQPGNNAVAIRADGKVCALAGWRVRLYSTKTLKPLGTLDYHKDGCQSLAFASPFVEPASTHTRMGADEEDSDEEGIDAAEKTKRGRWLASGSRDGRVAIWALMNFEKTA